MIFPWAGLKGGRGICVFELNLYLVNDWPSLHLNLMLFFFRFDNRLLMSRHLIAVPPHLAWKCPLCVSWGRIYLNPCQLSTFIFPALKSSLLIMIQTTSNFDHNVRWTISRLDLEDLHMCIQNTSACLPLHVSWHYWSSDMLWSWVVIQQSPDHWIKKKINCAVHTLLLANIKLKCPMSLVSLCKVWRNITISEAVTNIK